MLPPTRATRASRGESLRCTGYVVIQDCYKGESAMHGAALHGWMKLAEVLKQAGADLDPMEADGMTPLDYAMGRYRLGSSRTSPCRSSRSPRRCAHSARSRRAANAQPLPPGARPVVVAEVPTLPY